MISYLAVIQAHMRSKRLPGKVMMDLCSKPVIWHVAERLKISKEIEYIVVAASEDNNDDILCDYLHEAGVDCFRGSEEDVLDRFYRVSQMHPSDAIVRVTSDNPLIDPRILDETVAFFENEQFDYVRTAGFPAGIGAEVFKPGLLQKAFEQAHTAYEREHVTPYMYTGRENSGAYMCGDALEYIRLTIDTENDFQNMQDIYRHLYKGKHDFFLDDILNYLKVKRELCSKNRGEAQKTLAEGQPYEGLI